MFNNISTSVNYLICVLLIISFGCNDPDLNENEALCEFTSEAFFGPSNRTFIPPKNAEDILSLCHRTPPENTDGYFDLDFERICFVQNNLKKVIPFLESNCSMEEELLDLDQYHYQFLGLTINQTEHIYINAFVLPDVDTLGIYDNWKDTFIDICGGGIERWGALINLNTGELSHVSVNLRSDLAVLEPGPETEISLCTRCLGFKGHTYFSITAEEVCLLERNFEKIEDIQARTCNFVGRRILFTDNTVFQYVGVVIDNKKFIYINGLDYYEPSHHGPNDLHQRFMAYCDGGWSFWGILFDLETAEFSNLQFNAVR